MLIAIISVAIAGLLFLCAFKGFQQGVRLGMLSAKGEVPPLIKTPIQVVQETVSNIKHNKENKEFADAFNLVLNYDGNAPKEE